MYVYWWHVGGLRAVMVGHADDPERRVSDYRGEYGLSGTDVRDYELDDGIDAEWVESQLCRMLETRGLRRIALQPEEVEEDEEEEDALFALDGWTFEEAHILLHDTARHIAFAEISNRRKQQKRHELKAAEEWTPDEQEEDTDEADEGPDEQPNEQQLRPTAPAPPSPGAVRPWLYLIGAIVACGLVTGLGADHLMRSGPADPTEQNGPSVAAASRDGDSLAGPSQDAPCSLVEFSDTLVHVSCAGSWASMRWNGQWTFDRGHNESDALDFFNASDVARRVVALPARESVPELPTQAVAKPDRLPQSVQPAASVTPAASAASVAPSAPAPAAAPAAPAPSAVLAAPAPAAAPAAPPPQPRPRQATPLPATAPPQEAPPSARPCAVSRPKPGYQVYLVTCPNSRVMIGRTVDSTAGWTVSESVNGTEAIEFFMKSPYAR